MNEINFEIKDVEKIDLSMDVGVKEIYPPIENLEVIPTKEQQVFNHENSYGYDEVIVNPIPEEYIIPDGTLPITENATYDVRNYARVSASVHPAPNLQDKELTINENGTQNIVADEGYDGLNQVSVTVDAIEDLTEELETYNAELTTQETTIKNIIEALKNKTISSGSCDNSMEDGLVTRTVEEYSNDRVASVGKYLFYNITNLTGVSFPNATSIDMYAFYGCSGLTTIDFPNVINIKTYGFSTCYNLTTINFPQVTDIGSYAFSSCGKLSSVILPEVINLSNQSFKSCKVLKKVDLPKATYMSLAFYQCSQLEALILRSETLCTSDASYAFTGTKIGDGTGYIYVPKALIEEYKVATNWNNYENQFRAIEDYPEICG